MISKILTASFVLCLAACSSNKTEPATETPATTTPATTETPAPATVPDKHEYAVKASYSSDMSVGDPKLADNIVELWKQYDENTIEKGIDYFADTVQIWGADGWRYRGPRDSLMKMVKKMRSGFKTNHTDIVAIAPLKSNDKDVNWVCMWGTEHRTDLKNKVDSSDIQENWAFDKNGKVNFMHSYSRKLHK